MQEVLSNNFFKSNILIWNLFFQVEFQLCAGGNRAVKTRPKYSSACYCQRASQTRGILRGWTNLITWVFKNVFQYARCMAYFLNILTSSPSASWVSSLFFPVLISSRLEGPGLPLPAPSPWAPTLYPHSPVSSWPTRKSSPRGWTCMYVCIWKRSTWMWTRFLHLAGPNSHAKVQGKN